MVDVPRQDSGTAPAGSFQLERFEWVAPDRLVLAGGFDGVAPTAQGATLVVHGAEGEQRLPAASAEGVEPGGHWEAEFAWREPPVAFQTATLELDDGLQVELPAPGAKRPRFRQRAFEVRRAGAAATPATPAAPAGGVRLEAELLAAQEEARQLAIALAAAEEQLDRARVDLAAERAGRAEDAERFRAGLARLSESGEQAVAAERSAAEHRTAAFATARTEAQAAHADAERLLARLTALVRAVEDPGAPV
jgi:hypothetical protein